MHMNASSACHPPARLSRAASRLVVALSMCCCDSRRARGSGAARHCTHQHTALPPPVAGPHLQSPGCRCIRKFERPSVGRTEVDDPSAGPAERVRAHERVLELSMLSGLCRLVGLLLAVAAAAGPVRGQQTWARISGQPLADAASEWGQKNVDMTFQLPAWTIVSLRDAVFPWAGNDSSKGASPPAPPAATGGAKPFSNGTFTILGAAPIDTSSPDGIASTVIDTGMRVGMVPPLVTSSLVYQVRDRVVQRQHARAWRAAVQGGPPPSPVVLSAHARATRRQIAGAEHTHRVQRTHGLVAMRRTCPSATCARSS